MVLPLLLPLPLPWLPLLDPPLPALDLLLLLLAAVLLSGASAVVRATLDQPNASLPTLALSPASGGLLASKGLFGSWQSSTLE